MSDSIDFILPSCYGIPESMWMAASAMLDTILKRCWALLGAFVVGKMLMSAFNALGEERVALGAQLRILAQAFFIAMFLTYYKTILMVFDYCMDSLCFFEVNVAKSTTEQAQHVSKSGNALMRYLLKYFKDMMALMTHKGSIRFMHYIKSVALLVLATIGPFAALFSLLPGPFSASFRTWTKGYLNVSCWTIILAVLDTLATGFATYSKGSTTFQALLSIVLFITAFFTPTWAAKLVSGINLGSLAAGVGSVPGKIGGAGLFAWQEWKDAKARRANKKE